MPQYPTSARSPSTTSPFSWSSQSGPVCLESRPVDSQPLNRNHGTGRHRGAHGPRSHSVVYARAAPRSAGARTDGPRGHVRVGHPAHRCRAGDVPGQPRMAPRSSLDGGPRSSGGSLYHRAGPLQPRGQCGATGAGGKLLLSHRGEGPGAGRPGARCRHRIGCPGSPGRDPSHVGQVGPLSREHYAPGPLLRAQRRSVTDAGR
jgi:hypothetical protein